MKQKTREKLEWLATMAVCVGVLLVAWACAMMMVGAFLGEEPKQPSEIQARIALEALEKEGE